jgi:hypothetical protein
MLILGLLQRFQTDSAAALCVLRRWMERSAVLTILWFYFCPQVFF